MKELAKLLDRIIQRININLRELDYNVNPFIKNLVPLNQMVKSRLKNSPGLIPLGLQELI